MNRVGNASKAPVHGAVLGRFRQAGQLAGVDGPCHLFFRHALRTAAANPDLESAAAGFLRTGIPEIPGNSHYKKTVRLWKIRVSARFQGGNERKDRSKSNLHRIPGHQCRRARCAAALTQLPSDGRWNRLLTLAFSSFEEERETSRHPGPAKRAPQRGIR